MKHVKGGGDGGGGHMICLNTTFSFNRSKRLLVIFEIVSGFFVVTKHLSVKIQVLLFSSLVFS